MRAARATLMPNHEKIMKNLQKRWKIEGFSMV